MPRIDSLEIQQKAWLAESKRLHAEVLKLKQENMPPDLLILNNLVRELRKQNKEGEEIIAQYIARHKGRVVQ